MSSCNSCVLTSCCVYLQQSFIAKHSTPHLRRPDSQATSVKAEPGSARGSTASASGKIISSHSHVAESIRSYVEDTTTVSPGCAPKVSLVIFVCLGGGLSSFFPFHRLSLTHSLHHGTCPSVLLHFIMHLAALFTLLAMTVLYLCLPSTLDHLPLRLPFPPYFTFTALPPHLPNQLSFAVPLSISALSFTHC